MSNGFSVESLKAKVSDTTWKVLVTYDKDKNKEFSLKELNCFIRDNEGKEAYQTDIKILQALRDERIKQIEEQRKQQAAVGDSFVSNTNSTPQETPKPAAVTEEQKSTKTVVSNNNTNKKTPKKTFTRDDLDNYSKAIKDTKAYYHKRAESTVSDKKKIDYETVSETDTVERLQISRATDLLVGAFKIANRVKNLVAGMNFEKVQAYVTDMDARVKSVETKLSGDSNYMQNISKQGNISEMTNTEKYFVCADNLIDKVTDSDLQDAYNGLVIRKELGDEFTKEDDEMLKAIIKAGLKEQLVSIGDSEETDEDKKVFHYSKTTVTQNAKGEDVEETFEVNIDLSKFTNLERSDFDLTDVATRVKEYTETLATLNADIIRATAEYNKRNDKIASNNLQIAKINSSILGAEKQFKDYITVTDRQKTTLEDLKKDIKAEFPDMGAGEIVPVDSSFWDDRSSNKIIYYQDIVNKYIKANGMQYNVTEDEDGNKTYELILDENAKTALDFLTEESGIDLKKLAETIPANKDTMSNIQAGSVQAMLEACEFDFLISKLKEIRDDVKSLRDELDGYRDSMQNVEDLYNGSVGSIARKEKREIRRNERAKKNAKSSSATHTEKTKDVGAEAEKDRYKAISKKTDAIVSKGTQAALTEQNNTAGVATTRAGIFKKTNTAVSDQENSNNNLTKQLEDYFNKKVPEEGEEEN